MGNIVCYDDPCPSCGLKHRKYPGKCIDDVREAIINAHVELLNEDFIKKLEVLEEDMDSYAAFWLFMPEGVEREGDIE